MLRTPASFVTLLRAQEHPAPLNFVFRGDELLVSEADLGLPADTVLAQHGVDVAQFHPVGLFDKRYCRTTWVAADIAATEGYTFRRLRALFGAMEDGLLAIAGRAFQIAHWARTHRFCGACGQPTTHMSGERGLRCPACQHVAYPRISPAMMVLVRRGEHILLARHKASPLAVFTALAGFLEAGESVEEAVHREVAEEVGLQVRDLRYFGSQPWPFPHSLMIAFVCDFAGGEIRPQAGEIEAANWFDVLQLPKLPSKISIARRLIDAVVEDLVDQSGGKTNDV